MLDELEKRVELRVVEELPNIFSRALKTRISIDINCPKKLALATYIRWAIKYKRRCKKYKEMGWTPYRIEHVDGLSLVHIEDNKDYYRSKYYGSECTCGLPERCCRKGIRE